LNAGPQQLAAHVEGDDQLPARLEKFLRLAWRLADREPGAILAADGALEQAHALVGDVQLPMLVVADAQLAQVNHAWRYREPRTFQDLGRQLVEKVIQTPIGIGELCGSMGRQGQVGSTQAAQEALQVALPQQGPGFRPLFLAGQGELVEVPTGPA
jgi:hypothetical protein